MTLTERTDMLQAGDIVKIENKNHRRILDGIVKDQEAARVAFCAASEMIRETDKRLWDFLHETHPDTIGRTSRYKSEDYSIEIMATRNP